MSKKTQRELLVAALTRIGFDMVYPAPSTKYITMVRVRPSPGEARYWIGKAGALRYGRTAGSSVPVSEKTRRRLLAEGA